MDTPPTSDPAERILAVADRLFYEQGFAATGVNQLIAEASVAKASFYRHFPGKEDLVVAYLRHRLDGFVEGARQAVERHRSPRDGILALFDFIDEWLRDTAYRGCAFQNAAAELPDSESSARRVVREAKGRQRELVAELCRKAGCPAASDEIFLLMEGALSQAAITRASWPVEAARRAAQRLLDS
ncbi:MAG: TetR/AcrR family transcriptional regulator [Holophagales bacterium]|nr:TetR/AcrR family transcriptional regulator [Holophagales bacterium]